MNSYYQKVVIWLAALVLVFGAAPFFAIGAPVKKDNLPPTNISLSITTMTQGAAPSGGMLILGSNFMASSTVEAVAVPLLPFSVLMTFVSESQLSISSTELNSLQPGNYSFSVTNPAPGGGTAVSSNNLMVTVPAPTTGSIMISKTAIGGNGTFNFTIVQASAPPTASLIAVLPFSDTFSITTVNGNGSFTETNLEPGLYSITEAPASGWTKGPDNCSSIMVIAGQTATCAFANTFNTPIPVPTTGNLRIIKNTTGGNGLFQYAIFPSPTAVSIQTSSGTGASNLIPLNAGFYKITEAIPSDWTFDKVSCDNSSANISSSGGSSITVDIQITANQTTNCTFFNLSSTSINIAVNANGGIATTPNPTFGFTSNFAGTFSLTTNQGTAQLLTEHLVPSSVYSIAPAAAPTGWTFAGSSCNNGIPSAITAIAGQITTCTFNYTFSSTTGGGGDDGGVISLPNPGGDPTITSITPTAKTECEVPFTLTVNGSNFVSGSIISFGGFALSNTTFVSSTKLTAVMTSLPSEGTYSVTVTNPSPNGGTSTPIPFTVNSSSTPSPTITSISPDKKMAGDPSFTLTITGSNFTGTSKVNFNGASKPATFISTSQLSIEVSTTDIATAGSYPIDVVNGSGTCGNGNSNSISITVIPKDEPTPDPTPTPGDEDPTKPPSDPYDSGKGGPNFFIDQQKRPE